MAEKNCLVIVESPTKAKTIRKFLPKNFEVAASMGHVRDLPQSAADIPAKFKKESWANLGVNVDADFAPLYVVPKGKSKVITELKKLLADADELYLATDEDREGESISWHLLELLKPKVPVKRMVFHEITKTAIKAALEDCREVDQRLVHAQETRRILDRLYGYTLSPLLWKKITYGLSAGRVQSVGLRLLVERERERRLFHKATYWGVRADLDKSKKIFEAKLVELDGKRLAIGKDFDPATGKLFEAGKVVVLAEKDANSLLAKLKNEKWIVESIEEKEASSKPSAPFITSTLQQEANRKLGMSARDTMRTAQKLYEQGLITYMRTDSPHLSTQAINAARSFVEKLYGKDYLSPEVRQFKSGKGAQEAHEAIRPAGDEFVHPDDAGLEGREQSLYNLIWMRTVATQMAEARKAHMTVRIQAGNATFTATGTRILFPGFLRAYVEGSDNPEAALGDQETILPPLKEKDQLGLDKLEPTMHETKPVARFTEASLIQELEKNGIGRPSTYASIISTILERNYARKAGAALVPTFTGFAVVQILERYFDHLIDYGFTSRMEDDLDEIAEGKQAYLPYLKKFYQGKQGLATQVEAKEKTIDAKACKLVLLENLESVEVNIGRFGAYLIRKAKGAEEQVNCSIPEDVAPADLTQDMVEEILTVSKKGPQSIGVDPKSGQQIYCLIGRFGPYVQLGEITDENPKPRRASVTKDIKYAEITVEQALQLLSLPRELGKHPTTGEAILANRGRFGPYVQHVKDYRSLKKEDDVFTVTLERALELLAMEKKGFRRKKKGDAD